MPRVTRIWSSPYSHHNDNNVTPLESPQEEDTLMFLRSISRKNRPRDHLCPWGYRDLKRVQPIERFSLCPPNSQTPGGKGKHPGLPLIFRLDFALSCEKLAPNRRKQTVDPPSSGADLCFSPGVKFDMCLVWGRPESNVEKAKLPRRKTSSTRAIIGGFFRPLGAH